MSLHTVLWRMGMIPVLLLVSTKSSYAVDSYRFLHVHIDTLWFIFLFLLCIIFVPFILMAVLSWHYAGTKSERKEQQMISAEREQ